MSDSRTRLKRFPPYVFSRLCNAALVHQVEYVEARWNDMGVRLEKPRLLVVAKCGAYFYAGFESFGSRKGEPMRRAATCSIPKPNAVHCGKCQGKDATFVRGSLSTQARRDARKRLGCAMEASL